MTRTGLAIFLVSILTNANAHATIYSLNSRLDTAIESADLVVTGRISKIRRPDQPFVGGSYPDLQFKVDQVIIGKRELEGRVIEFPKLSLYWPHQLVPFEKGSFCVLLLKDSGPEPKELDELSRLLLLPWKRYRPTVVPVRRRRFARLADVKAVRRLLATEILDELKHETSLLRQRSLMTQVSSIVSREECTGLIPFIKSKNEWVSRSALAALVYATRDDKYVRMAADDVNRFSRARSADLSFLIRHWALERSRRIRSSLTVIGIYGRMVLTLIRRRTLFCV